MRDLVLFGLVHLRVAVWVGGVSVIIGYRKKWAVGGKGGWWVRREEKRRGGGGRKGIRYYSRLSIILKYRIPAFRWLVSWRGIMVV